MRGLWLVLLLASPAAAQTQKPCLRDPVTFVDPVPIAAGASFSIAADADSLDCHTPAQPTVLLSARCAFDETIFTPAVMTPGGVLAYTIVCPAPALPPGPHWVQVGTTNASGEGWSDILSFTVAAAQPPPQAVNCVVSDWSGWTLVTPATTPPTGRHTRTVLTPAANGGLACPALSETAEVCPYVTPAGVLTPVPLGTVKEGENVFPSIKRNDDLLRMGMELLLRKDSATTVHMKATCVGVPPGV